MQELTTEEILTIIEQSECTITEAAVKLAEAVKELKRRESENGG